jgi:hypothetical protein
MYNELFVTDAVINSEWSKPIYLVFSCFQKNAYYVGIKIFNILPSNLTSLANKKAQFKVALKRYLITHMYVRSFTHQMKTVSENHMVDRADDSTFLVLCEGFYQ